MKINLKDFKKMKKPDPMVNISATIRQDQEAFLLKQRINFSAFIREIIDQLMNEASDEKRKAE